MTRVDIANYLCDSFGDINKGQALGYVDAVFGLMKESLARGENVKISGFGNFVTTEKKKRIGRNPQTGEEIVIDARTVVTFKVSDVLRKQIRDNP
jgi:integration host factor subunit alpha